MTRSPDNLDPDLERLQRWLLIAWCALLVSASLYPFDWDWHRLFDELRQGFPKLRRWVDPSRRDLIVNLLLYVPLGFIGALLGARSGLTRRLLQPLLGAAFLSLLIEVLQHALGPRDPTLSDWLLNVTSALIGIVLAMLYPLLPISPLSTRLRRLHIGPGLGLLIALWLIAHLAPFVPRLRPGRINAAWETSLAMDLVPSRLLGFFVCYLIIGALMRALIRRESYWPWLASLLLFSLVSRLLFVGQHLSPDEVFGCLLAIPVIVLTRRLPGTQSQPLIFTFACMGIALAGLWPTSEQTETLIFWIPFAELIGGAGDPGALTVLERLFIGIGVAWLAATSGRGGVQRLAVPVGIILCSEILQQWIPGRITDTSDLAAVLIGAALVQATPRTT